MKALLLTALFLPVALASTTGPEDARSEYRRLTKEYAKATKEYERDLERNTEALTKEEVAEYEADWNPNHAYVELFAEQGALFAGSDNAVMFLEWIVKYAMMDGDVLSAACDQALATLLDHHRDNEGFRSTISNAGYMSFQLTKQRVLAILARVIDYGDEELSLSAFFSRGVAYSDRDATKDDREFAMSAFKRVIELAPDSTLAKTANGYIFEMENLQIGNIAPDIQGPDLDGVSFRLSDYRGKVVFLDFWGDW